ncbi:hypothetical protein QOZ80_5AG0395700 [Eleusine coracana subsp. coracana]|nr:hypothetical protein QOZ80_5AG0395700 [Eleusine coracana subsp. coracana]
MEISSQTFLFAAALLLPFSWLLLHFMSGSASSKQNISNGRRRRIPIPSPPGRPITGHLHLLKKPLHRSLAALARRHDVGGTGLLRLRFGARPVVLVSSPAIADECFTVHDGALADRPSLASRRLLTGDDCPSISTASYGPLWRRLRRLAVVHALCAHRLAATAAARDAEARAMAAKLWRAAAGGPREVSVKAVAYEFVVNVIMAMVAGERMPEEKVVQFKEMTEAGFAAAGAANRQDFLPALRLLDVFGKTRKKLAGLAKVRHQFGQSIVDDYRRRRHRSRNAAAEEPRTVIGDLLREQERSPESLDDVVIRTVCLSLLQAGTDTSSCTIEWAMALLLNNMTVLTKATAEIDSIVGTFRLLLESDLADLPYLHCIITETLRLYPLTPHLVPHEASHDCELSTGHVIERGTMVLVDVYSMQRNPDIWDDPKKFLPERFMGAKKDGDSRWMMPFGMGRRKCPGEGLALRTVGMALGVLIQCFDWERIHKEEVDMSEGSGLTMPMAVPLVAMCRPRVEMDKILSML